LAPIGVIEIPAAAAAAEEETAFLDFSSFEALREEEDYK
jgi:hypothetical protein